MAAMGTELRGRCPSCWPWACPVLPRTQRPQGCEEEGGCVRRGRQAAPELEAARAASPLQVLDRSPPGTEPRPVAAKPSLNPVLEVGWLPLVAGPSPDCPAASESDSHYGPLDLSEPQLPHLYNGDSQPAHSPAARLRWQVLSGTWDGDAMAAPGPPTRLVQAQGTPPYFWVRAEQEAGRTPRPGHGAWG